MMGFGGSDLSNVRLETDPFSNLQEIYAVSGRSQSPLMCLEYANVKKEAVVAIHCRFNDPVVPSLSGHQWDQFFDRAKHSW